MTRGVAFLRGRVVMGKSSSSAPSADPAIGQAALKQAQTGADWLNFSKDAFRVSTERQSELDALTKQVTEQQLGIANEQAGWARSDRARYENTFKPIEDQFIEEATNYATPEKQAEAAASARADVQSAADAQRGTALRQSAAMGINPNSGRFAGIDRAGELGTALAAAGAENNARLQVRDKGLALKADVANLGRGLPAQSAQATSLGLNAGNSAVGNTQATNQQYTNSTGIMGQGYSGAMAGYGGQANTLTNLYNSQVNAWSAQQQADASSMGGLFSGLGSVAGAAIMASDKNAKTDKKKVPDGAGLEAVKKMPVEEWTYKDGIGDGGRHVGTYAQDFKKATGKGDGKGIAVVDAIGITMKAVQDLDKKVDRLGKAVGLGQRVKEAA